MDENVRVKQEDVSEEEDIKIVYVSPEDKINNPPNNPPQSHAAYIKCESPIDESEIQIEETKLTMDTFQPLVQPAHNAVKSYECYVCKYCAKSVASLRKHLGRHRVVRTHNCKFCGQMFEGSYRLQQHINFKHKGKAFECTKCFKIFQYNAALKTHMIACPPTCPICKIEFRRKDNLRVHMMRHSENKPFECRECSKQFISLHELNAHKVVHKDDRPFSCEVCEKKFKRKGNLNRHKKTHSDESSLPCDESSCKFKHRSSFSRHERTSHNRPKARSPLPSTSFEPTQTQ